MCIRDSSGNLGGSSLPSSTSNAPSSPLSYAELKERNKLIKQAEKAVAASEQKIARLEEEKADIEAKLATPEGAADPQLFALYSSVQKQLSEAEDEWTEASINLDELKSK